MSKKHHRPEPAAKPQPGAAPGGKSINPMGLPEEPDAAAREGGPKPAPGPGLPISDEEYDRLKEAAKHSSAPPVENAQEDRPPKNTCRKTNDQSS
jgi:hypothetical protein